MHITGASAAPAAQLSQLRTNQAPRPAHPAPPTTAKADADGDQDGTKGKKVDARA